MQLGNSLKKEIDLIDVVLLKFEMFALKPELCEIGDDFRLQNGPNLFCRVWLSSLRPKRSIIWY